MTAAPYPGDTRAKGWRFEFDVERIEQSDTWTLAPSALRPWLLMLWMTAWKQTPCGTLTNDDTLIAARIGMAPKEFAKHRAILMRGWWLADDGRLYHAALTERVEAMLVKREKDAGRTAARRARTAGAAASPPEVTELSRVTPEGLTCEFDTKHQAPSTSKTEPVGSVPARKARGSKRCPPTFEVTAEMLAWAAVNASKADVARETLKFRNWEFAKAHSDWMATWQNWILTADERAAAPRPAQTETFRERDLRLATERVAAFTGQRPADTRETIEIEATDVTPRALGR